MPTLKLSSSIFAGALFLLGTMTPGTAAATNLYPFPVAKPIPSVTGITTLLDFRDVGRMATDPFVTESDIRTLSAVWIVPQFVTLSVQDNGQTTLKVAPYVDHVNGGYGVTIDMLLKSDYRPSKISELRTLAPALNFYYPMADTANFSAITIGNDIGDADSLDPSHVSVVAPSDPFSVVGAENYFQVRLDSVALNAWRCAQDLLDDARRRDKTTSFDSLSILTGHVSLHIPTFTYQSARNTPETPVQTAGGGNYLVRVNIDELGAASDVVYAPFLKLALQRFAARMKQLSQSCDESRNEVQGQHLSTYAQIQAELSGP